MERLPRFTKLVIAIRELNLRSAVLIVQRNHALGNAANPVPAKTGRRDRIGESARIHQNVNVRLRFFLVPHSE
jgi:hypothetical protein